MEGLYKNKNKNKNIFYLLIIKTMKFIEYDKIQFTNFNIFENYFKTKINLDFKKNNVIKINSFNLPKFIYHLPFLPLIKEDRDIILKDL